MQGVQQTGQQADKAGADHGGDPAAPQEDSQPPGDDDAKHRDEPRQRAEAAPGESANTGRAPEPPHAERAQPAQTRPQTD
jgi:hypothetical protein